MNKSILLVVCDFLVLSLLSFISFDKATAEEGASISQAALEEAKNQRQSVLSLQFKILNAKIEEQQKENEEQSTKLGAEKDALEKALADREKNLDQRIAELEKTRKNLENTEELATNLAEEKARLQKERTSLQKEKSKLKEERDILTGQTKEAADTRAVLLTEVKDLESKKAVVGERLKNMQNEVEKKKAELSQQQKELALIDSQKNAVLEEKQTLQVALAQKDATLSSTKDVLAKTEGTLASAQQNIQTLQGDKVQLQGTLAQSEAQKAFIAKQKMVLEKQATELEKKTQQLMASKGQLEKEKTGLQDEKRDLQTSLEKSRLQIEANKKEEERIRQSIAAAKADLERQRKEAATELARQEADKARLLAEKEKIMDNNRKLTENVATLEKKTEEIKNKIDKAQPLSPNTIFTHFRNAQVRLKFLSLTKGILGATQTREFNIPATLVEDSRGVFAVTLIKDSPFEIRRARSATSISGTLFVGSKKLPVLDVSYAKDDPRVLIVPLPPGAADGLHRFKIDSDPYHFPKAILVDPNGKGYGEMAFNIHAENDQYIELKSGILRSLSGEFTQSTGDFTFSQTGHFLGVLVNRNHAIRLPDLSSPYKMPLGDAFDPERTSLLSDILERRVRILNAELH
jgi:chromosome segregation ATPase